METKLCPIVGVVLCVLFDERAQGDGYSKKFYMGGSTARSNLPFYILFLTEKVHLSYTLQEPIADPHMTNGTSFLYLFCTLHTL